ncbi:MAG: class 1 fructose-bisphosphatase [Candidatus Pacebacteria bacterium]|nr:class 1 fructose-bisphosphatase [Candidatus Paceibacterota bacterium]MBT3511573.1 class 1 fructose-bisphosphatase [Candidatus Paceibacterota bacterium]MBT4004957.1 class 1 fructose-bisphosphatase [Candidatus Paceibacterota bacterium]MBT4358733.1 class 1 fructose-bisphosphatase [Candidatus Paceibacterota bacterium]MBT4680700.1 class 1 fructose-bisphosphatase [Candidatus Paceibacterota bacterium]
MPPITNLTDHLLKAHVFNQRSRELAEILNQIMISAKIVSHKTNRAGLTDILGAAGKTNVQDEEVQKLDEYAHDIFVRLLKQSPYIKAVGSEEEPDLIVFNEDYHDQAEYIMHMDPLDGSSNIDVNVSVGTIFLIYRKQSFGQNLEKSDYLQPGKNAVCAGYVLYGSSTMLVYSTGQGMHGFTLDPNIGEFLLSHEDMTLPEASNIYSVNESYQPKWDQALADHVSQMKTDQDISGKPKTARYIGSLVADFHRNLLKGGIFLYPADKKHPNGKLRLLYEGIPFAFLIKAAGGYASDGQQDVLEIVPTELHQRAPLFIGNKPDVKLVEKLLKK